MYDTLYILFRGLSEMLLDISEYWRKKSEMCKTKHTKTELYHLGVRAIGGIRVWETRTTKYAVYRLPTNQHPLRCILLGNRAAVRMTRTGKISDSYSLEYSPFPQCLERIGQLVAEGRELTVAEALQLLKQFQGEEREKRQQPVK